jgi:hypothetical protein
MSANYDSYVQQQQWQAEQNLLDYNNFNNLNKYYDPRAEARRAIILAREREIESEIERKRESERNRENILDKRKKSLLYQTNYDDNGNYRPNRFLTTFNNKPIVPTMSRNSNRRNSNRKNISTKSKGGRKRKSGRKTKKNGW